MRTKESIQLLIKEIRDNTKRDLFSDDKSFNKARSTANRKIDLYNTHILFIESEPSEDFLNKQLALVQKKIKLIDKQFDLEYNNAMHKEQFLKTKGKFYRENGFDILNNQLKFLKFILNT
jgi:hypothetical protein